MLYSQIVDYFFSKLPMFSRDGKKAIRPKLDNIKELVRLLEIDLDSVPYIHVAGTNGKGSTCHIIAASLQEAGFKVGLLTSPHLVDIRERVKINGELVSKDIVVEFAEKVMNLEKDIQPSYFEMTVTLAFYTFAKLKLDYAVIETGLGGRWDCTNIITPILSVITSIDYDHTDILGDTLDKIAYQKAGIIKPQVPVLIGKTQPETTPVFLQVALAQQAAIHFADHFFVSYLAEGLHEQNLNSQARYFYESGKLTKHMVVTDLLGHYQWDNLKTAWAAIRILNSIGVEVDDAHFLDAAKRVKKLTQFRGRWDNYAKNIILDVGHNPEGIQAAMQNLKNFTGKLLIVYGSVKDKDVSSSITYLPKNAQYYLTQAQVPRALAVADLKVKFDNIGIPNTQTFDFVKDAVHQAIQDIDDDSLLLIIGSFFVVGEAYQYLDEYFN